MPTLAAALDVLLERERELAALVQLAHEPADDDDCRRERDPEGDDRRAAQAESTMARGIFSWAAAEARRK